MHEYCIGQDYVYAPNLISSPHRTVITFVFTSEASIYNRGMWSFLECEKMCSCVSDPSLLLGQAFRKALSHSEEMKYLLSFTN